MKRTILVVLLLGSVALPISARSRRPSFFMPIQSTVVQDTGNWSIAQDNLGRFVASGSGSRPGGYWPKDSGHGYLFGAGIWVGIIDTTVSPPDTQVTWGYNPNSGQAEFCPSTPDGDPSRYLDSLARVYDSRNPADTALWPERDSSGRMIVDSHQELWAICNDVNPIYMVAPDSSIGIQVIRRSYAWNSPGPWGDIVKMEFEVKNVTGRWMGNPHTLAHVIIALCMDGDIGNESGTNANDHLYLDHTPGNPYPNLAVQFQTVQEPGWGSPPYFFGMKFVDGPLNNTGDTLRIRSDPTNGYPEYDHDIPPGQPLGMTAFQIFTIDVDPSLPGQRYLELTGRYYMQPTIYNAYQKDTFGPGDKRFLLSCGPFDLPNDSSVTLTAHIIGGTDSLDILHKAEQVGVETPPKAFPQRISGLELYPVTPNPVTGSALIRYALPASSRVTLKVYDISGRLVRELDRGANPVGIHAIKWDCKDGSGREVPGGVYFYRLKTKTFAQTRKLVVIR